MAFEFTVNLEHSILPFLLIKFINLMNEWVWLCGYNGHTNSICLPTTPQYES